MPTIPKTTAPLVKFIRSGEGVLVYLFGAILVLIPIITSNLPPALASSLSVGKYVTIAAVVSRSGLKAISQLSAIPALAPVAPSGVPSDATIEKVATTVAADVQEVTQVVKPESAVKPDAPAPVVESAPVPVSAPNIPVT